MGKHKKQKYENTYNVLWQTNWVRYSDTHPPASSLPPSIIEVRKPTFLLSQFLYARDSHRAHKCATECKGKSVWKFQGCWEASNIVFPSLIKGGNHFRVFSLAPLFFLLGIWMRCLELQQLNRPLGVRSQQIKSDEEERQKDPGSLVAGTTLRHIVLGCLSRLNSCHTK